MAGLDGPSWVRPVGAVSRGVFCGVVMKRGERRCEMREVREILRDMMAGEKRTADCSNSRLLPYGMQTAVPCDDIGVAALNPIHTAIYSINANNGKKTQDINSSRHFWLEAD